MNLAELGWNQQFNQHFEACRGEGLSPARVAREEKNAYLVLCEQGELAAEICGKLRHEAQSKGDLPSVGDWVVVSARPDEGKATIRAVLPRKSRFVRKAAGLRTEQQVIAANVDTIFLVTGLDGDFSARRIERYLTLAWESGARPVVLLNKADLCPDLPARLAEVEASAMNTPVHAVSAALGRGLEALHAYLGAGQTAAFIGSSGVGKSTLINALLGEARLKTAEVRQSDGTGRHTTTHRELILLPGRGLVIDTPGLRELQLWADEEAVERTFEDIESLAQQCRFSDCAHRSEPGCAVRAAMESGTLDSARWQSYVKLQRELRHLARRRNQQAVLIQKAVRKKIALARRRINKERET
jgi:ribosome biogenesis GTPase / thiamine phosphate phosphatase